MQNLENYYGELITALVTLFATSVPRFFFDRKKEATDVERINQENRKSEVELVEKIATIWRENSESYDVRFKEQQAQMDKIREELNALREENRTLKSENGRLKKDIERLTARIKELETNHG